MKEEIMAKYVVRFGKNGYLSEDGDTDARQRDAMRHDSVEEAWLNLIDQGLDGQGARVVRLKPKADRVPVLYANFRGTEVLEAWDTKEEAEAGNHWGSKPDEIGVPLYR